MHSLTTPASPHALPEAMFRPQIFGESRAMRAVIEEVARAAGKRTGVVISGEPGTGRRTLARAIHARDSRPDAPFVEVECARRANPDLESRLFGPPAATETAADNGAAGLEAVVSDSLAYQARRGSLLLLNVVDMPARVQARLARLLRDNEAWHVDACARVPADIRPMACVDRSFDDAVRQGWVRAELGALLTESHIRVPPLCERREDIPALANHLLDETCVRAGAAPKTLTRAALALLSAMPYEDNARELRLVLERLARRVPGPSISLEDVLAGMEFSRGTKMAFAGATLREARRQFERQYIEGTLERHQGRVAGAARALGIQRTNLYRKMRTLGIPAALDERPRFRQS